MASKKFVVKNGLRSDDSVLINKSIDNNVDKLQVSGSVSVSDQVKSTLATGTAPLIIASTTAVSNLNADLLDDQHGSYYLDGANFTGTLPNDYVTLGTMTAGNYVATIAGTTNEVAVTGSGSETAAVTIGLPDDVTIGNELTVTTGLFTPLIDTTDSSAITIVPEATFNSNVTVENTLTVGNDVSITGSTTSTGDITAVRFFGDGTGLTGLVATYDSLTDTNTTGRTTGSFNRFNGSAYVPTTMTEDANGNVVTNGDVTFTGDNNGMVWNKSDNALDFERGDGTVGQQIRFRGDDATGFDSYIYVSPTNSEMIVSSSNTVRVYAGNNFLVQKTSAAETMINAAADGSVSLYYDGNKKLETVTDGVEITGTLYTSNIDTSDSSAITVTPIVNFDSDVNVGNNLIVDGYIGGPATMVIDPSAIGDDTGEVIIAGNLTVQGNTTQVDSNVVNIGDAFLTLNSDETSTPSQNAGIEVERGTSTNVALRWNEGTDKWETTTDGSAYYSLVTSNDAITISDGSTTQAVNMGETLTFADGTDIDVVVSATNTLTVNHNVAGANTTISSTANTFVDEITVTAQGHVTSVATTAIDFNVADNYAFKTFTDGSNSAVAESNTDTFTFSKTDQIEVTVNAAGDSLTIGHADSGVSAASYGSSTAVPIITVDAQGHVTAVSTAAINTSWTISDGTTTQAIDGGDTLTVSGTANEVEVAVSATDTLTVGLPDDVTITNDLTVGNEVILDNHKLQSLTQTTAATTQVNLATFSSTTYAGAEVNIMAISAGERHITKLLITHDGTTADATEFGEIVTNAALATYDVDTSGGDVRIRVTPASATSTKFNTSITLIEN